MVTGSSASPSVFLVVDPVQDYEESLQVWGVFGSFPAAKHATRALRTRHLSAYQQDRLTEVQHWQGARHLAARWAARWAGQGGLAAGDRAGGLNRIDLNERERGL